jgi:hypothetical protein
MPVTVYMSDTAPVSPAPGQLWWNSTTGNLSIFYADADSTQWVQVSGNLSSTAPNDGNEYVMANGVWRLKAQTFNLAGKNTQDVTVPAWGPSQVRLTANCFNNTVAIALYLQVSMDGTNFLGGTAYWSAGFNHYTGSLGFASFAGSSAAQWQISAGTDVNPNVPIDVEAVVGLKPPSALNYYGFKARTGTYNGAAAQLWSHMFVHGQVQGTAAGVKAVRFYTASANGFSFGNLVAEWLP